jgi:hypothetical protein
LTSNSTRSEKERLDDCHDAPKYLTEPALVPRSPKKLVTSVLLSAPARTSAIETVA